MSIPLLQLAPEPDAPFPPAHTALDDPDGLLAFGGDLTATRLLNAYRHGIFPWFGEGQPILWWSPEQRCVFRPGQVHLSSRFRRSLRHCQWQITADRDFDAVMARCADIPRRGQDGTWITSTMKAAYSELHALGWAHSIEVRDGDSLVGGLYGLVIGQMFFAESMFSARSGASKLALAALALRMTQWRWPLIDAQLSNPHLLSLGAVTLPRDTFVAEVARLTALPAIEPDFATAFARVPASSFAGPNLCAKASDMAQ